MADLVLWDHMREDLSFRFNYRAEVYAGKSPYQTIQVIDADTLGRCLILDGKVQSAQLDEFVYHEVLVHPAMLHHQAPKRVLIGGGGEGATLREVLKHPTVEEVVMVDLDEMVCDVAKEHLGHWHQGAFDDPRVHLLHEDARAYVDQHQNAFDIIILDIADPIEEGPGYLLYTVEFYQMVRAALRPGGLVSTHAGMSSLIDPASFYAVHHTMRQVFANVQSYEANIPSFAGNWGFTMAGDQLQATDAELEGRARALNGVLAYLEPSSVRHALHLGQHHQNGLATATRAITR